MREKRRERGREERTKEEERQTENEDPKRRRIEEEEERATEDRRQSRRFDPLRETVVADYIFLYPSHDSRPLIQPPRRVFSSILKKPWKRIKKGSILS